MSGDKVQISIVIPAYNGSAYLARTIESVVAQTFGDWGLVIVDDGSTDDTSAVARLYAERHPRIRLIRQANHGSAVARNRGFAESAPGSEFFIFLDHDDLWEENALDLLLDALQAHPEAAAANGLSRIIDSEGRRREPGELEVWGRRRQGVVGQRMVDWPIEEPSTLAVLAFRNYIYTPGQALIRRSALEAVGPFDPAMPPCDDWDMWLRLSRRGGFAYVDRVVLSWRKHNRNVSGLRERLFEKECDVRRKLLSSADLTSEERRIAVAASLFWSQHFCSDRLRAAQRSFAARRFTLSLRLFRHAAWGYIRCARGCPAV